MGGEEVDEVEEDCFLAWCAGDAGPEDRGEEGAGVDVEVGAWGGEGEEGGVGEGCVGYCFAEEGGEEEEGGGSGSLSRKDVEDEDGRVDEVERESDVEDSDERSDE